MIKAIFVTLNLVSTHRSNQPNVQKSSTHIADQDSRVFGMHLNRILISTFLIRFTLASLHHLIVNHTLSEESIVISGIIKNYRIYHFNAEHIYISIIISPSQDVEYAIYEEFHRSLFNNSFETDFSYNIMYQLDDSIRYYRKAFNLILIQDSDELV